MAAVPSDLAESEMFGHEKGAFTGAVQRKPGVFERANKGTLFLDEVADMDAALQTKLLRVLQEKEFTRLGGTKVLPTDFRLIVATHKDLKEEVKAGRFRSDLYYRLLGLPIALPALRDRENDMMIIARHFIKSFCKENQLDQPTLSKEAAQKIKQYGFPGNIRELKAIVDLAVVMSDGKTIQEEDIQFTVDGSAEGFLLEEKSLKAYNADIIQHFLDKYDQNVQLVADKLDIGKSTIYNMKKSGLL